MDKDITISKEEQPLMVTIRCLTYNHEPYIRQCLEGFVMQKTNFRFEAIVHDDASTDGTAAIIREYAEKYPDIIKPIYETENQYSKHDGSLSRIMNANMHGKYVAMCEGDDYWIDPLKLQKQVDFLENHPKYSLTCHRYSIFDQEKKIMSDDGHNKLFGDKIGLEFTHDMPAWIAKTLTLLFRRDASYEYCTYKGKKRDSALVYFLLKNGKGYCFNEVMGGYRLHKGGVFGKQSLYTNIRTGYLVWRDLYNYEANRVTRKKYYSFYTSLLILSRGKILLEEKFDILKFISVPYFIFGKLKRRFLKKNL